MLKTLIKVTMVIAVSCGALTFNYAEANASKPEATAENVEATAKALQYLAQYEIDHSYILSQAMDSTSNTTIRERLLKVKQQIEANIKEYSGLIVKFGRQPPTYSRDFKGFFMQGYVAMRGLTSDKGVMQALHSNTNTVINAYEATLKSELPADVRQTITKILEEKRDFSRYLESQI